MLEENWGILSGLLGSVCSAYASVALKGGHNNRLQIDDYNEEDLERTLENSQPLNSFVAAPLPPSFHPCSPQSAPTSAASSSSFLPSSDFRMGWYPRVLQDRLWLRGIFLYVIVSPICFGIAVNLAPASIVLSLSAIHVLFNMIFAKIFLNEMVCRFDLVGTICITGGTALVFIFSGEKQESFAVPLHNLRSLEGICYIAVCFLAVFLSCSLAFGWIVRVLEKFFQIEVNNLLANFMNVLGLALISGVASGNTTLLGKLGLLLVERHSSSWLTLWPYLCILLLLCLGCTDLVFLNLALERGNAVYTVPIRSAAIFLPTTWGGWAIFGEAPDKIVLFSLGLLVTLLGVIFLSLGQLQDASVLQVSEDSPHDQRLLTTSTTTTSVGSRTDEGEDSHPGYLPAVKKFLCDLQALRGGRSV